MGDGHIREMRKEVGLLREEKTPAGCKIRSEKELETPEND
jgi:hypothetical protein